MLGMTTRGRYCFTRQGVPNLLRAHRSFLGIRQSDLARRIGCSIPLISRIERGRLMPRFETAVRLAREVGRTVPEVFPDLLPAMQALGASGVPLSLEREWEARP
jgi:transcriptional regulator with XRE-family HTH domain